MDSVPLLLVDIDDGIFNDSSFFQTNTICFTKKSPAAHRYWINHNSISRSGACGTIITQKSVTKKTTTAHTVVVFLIIDKVSDSCQTKYPDLSKVYFVPSMVMVVFFAYQPEVSPNHHFDPDFFQEPLYL